MSVASVHTISPLASLTVSSDSSDGGFSAILIALAVVGVIAVIALLGRSQATVVVVEKPAASMFGIVVIALALGILYFAWFAPSAGLT